MNGRMKTIAVTVLSTTLAWAAVIALVFWLAPKTDRIQAQFLTEKGALGSFDSTNTKTQTVVVVIEELPTAGNATSRVELARRELAPRQRLRVGVRELAEGGK